MAKEWFDLLKKEREGLILAAGNSLCVPNLFFQRV